MLLGEDVEYKRHLNRLPNFFLFSSLFALHTVISSSTHSVTAMVGQKWMNAITQTTVSSSSFPCGLRRFELSKEGVQLSVNVVRQIMLKEMKKSGIFPSASGDESRQRMMESQRHGGEPDEKDDKVKIEGGRESTSVDY